MASSQSIEETSHDNDLELRSYTALRLVCVTVKDGVKIVEHALTHKIRNMHQLSIYTSQHAAASLAQSRKDGSRAIARPGIHATCFQTIPREL